MKNCIRCGQHLADEADFCTNCGSPQVEEKVKCVNCGGEFYKKDLENGCPYCKGKGYKTGSSNGKATTLKVFAWLILIGGFIVGIGMGGTIPATDGSEFNDLVMLTIWATVGLYATLLFAFAEVIQILHDIREKLYS